MRKCKHPGCEKQAWHNSNYCTKHLKQAKTQYTVKPAGRKLVDDFRGDRIFGEVYTIVKDDVDTYSVTCSTIGAWCDCPGGRRGKCKHLEMVYEYLTDEAAKQFHWPADKVPGIG